MLKEKLMKKLHAKGAKSLDPHEKAAKLGVVKELGRQAGAVMSDKVHPLKKVSVASDSKEGLKEGLAKASGLVDHAPDMEHDPERIAEEANEAIPGDHGELAEGSAAEEALESPHEEQAELEAEHADKSPEELDAHIAKLQALKHKKLAGHLA